MNKKDRAKLREIATRITKLQEEVASIRGDELVPLREDERQKHDNLPAGLVDGKRGEAITEGIDGLEELESFLELAEEELAYAVDRITELIDIIG